jgi:ribosomal protein S18 acetylase RimI-like enzyme
VRSAACRDGRRTAPLDPERITRLRALCDPQGAKIRDAAPNEKADLEALQLRASLVWEEYRAPLLANPDAIELPAGAIEAGRVRVAVAEDGPTGFSVVMPVVDGACELDGLFVEPELMGRGIGRELIADVVARSDGATRLEVTANPRAIGFYEKLGFQPGETVQTRFGAGLRMHLDLRT